MIIEIKHTKNIDIKGGYWSKMKRPNNIKFTVKTLKQAVRKCQDFIEKYDLGGGNWDNANVIDHGVLIAHISYNGRVWDLQGNEIKI